MPNISELKKSSFITKSDLGPQGSLFTITGCEQVNVAQESAPPEMKWALIFREIEKPFILNSTNGQIIAAFTGADNTDNWTGKKVVIFFDPNVSFAGKLTGGLRARAPRNPMLPRPAQPTDVPAPAPVALSAPVTHGDMEPDSNIPF